MRKKLNIILFTVILVFIPATAHCMAAFAYKRLSEAFENFSGHDLVTMMISHAARKPTNTAGHSIVYKILIDHGIEPKYAQSITTWNDNSFEGQMNAGATFQRKRPIIIIPERTITQHFQSKSSEKINEWKGIIIHEFGHLKNKHAQKQMYLDVISALTAFNIYAQYRRAWTLIPSFAIAFITHCSYGKYSEYEADQETIQRCDSDILHTMAQKFYSRDALLRKNANNALYENNLLYRESWYSIIHKDTHPADLTRARYFKAAALKKEQEEAQLKKV